MALANEQAAGETRLEPNAELAYSWWPPHRNVWTPIGWKDHLFRFIVLYNGTVVAQPYYPRVEKAYAAKWDGLGVQLTVVPSKDGAIPALQDREPYQLCSTPDGGVGNQGWTESPTPVLWTEWPVFWTEWPLHYSGVVLRKEIFAHIPGADDVTTGVEPLYAWIRLSVEHVDELKAPEKFSFMIHLGAEHVGKSMTQEMNLKVFPDRSAYPRKLAARSFSAGMHTGLRVLEEKNKKIRLTAVSPDSGVFSFIERDRLPKQSGLDEGA
ncbi:MAG: hypothetical protein U9P14_06845, partial [Gemmatimonadota bacterium]|nr:hypothetical protein [Gemmatimonadota bacterium]